jgi:sugar (pentulose or hexulose) kinase
LIVIDHFESRAGEQRLAKGATIVIDLGKTLSKVSLWDRAGRMLDRVVRPNSPVILDGTKRLDIEGIGNWLIEALRGFSAHDIETIVPVGHGAGVVALDDDGPAFPPLDYEQALPGDVLAAYRKVRDPFAVTGSPALPDGLNFGAQLFWTDRLHGGSHGSTLVPWAQYWAWFLTGRAVSEVTSLGCHSDVWCPQSGEFAPLAIRAGWASRFAPVVRAGDTVGTLKPELARLTGLSDKVRVLAGLHDSNAALLAARGFPEIARNEATVLSTGTWFISMRLAAQSVDTASLPEARDCLVNVDAYGKPVPSARFMGGREIESVIGIDTRRVDIKPDQPALLAAVPEIIASGAMLLPTLAEGCGPFPGGRGEWIEEPADWYAKRAAACLYAALVADTAMDLIGTRERILVEGRFAEAEIFVRALAALRSECAVYTANAHNDVSFGALRLIDPDLKPQGELVRVQPLPQDLTAYRARWLANTKAPA